MGLKVKLKLKGPGLGDSGITLGSKPAPAAVEPAMLPTATSSAGIDPAVSTSSLVGSSSPKARKRPRSQSISNCTSSNSILVAKDCRKGRVGPLRKFIAAKMRGADDDRMSLNLTPDYDTWERVTTAAVSNVDDAKQNSKFSTNGALVPRTTLGELWAEACLQHHLSVERERNLEDFQRKMQEDRSREIKEAKIAAEEESRKKQQASEAAREREENEILESREKERAERQLLKQAENQDVAGEDDEDDMDGFA